jgi:alkyl sulfatase BDS1-like metallo-beta-lactamase superfamily hydrolase
MDKYELKNYLRNVALRLANSGLTSEEIADAMNLPRQTVAAWRAHETMGSYKPYNV